MHSLIQPSCCVCVYVCGYGVEGGIIRLDSSNPALWSFWYFRDGEGHDTYWQ